MTHTYRATIYLDTDTGEYAVPALFDYSTEFHPADRSTGHMADRDEVTSCELVSWCIGSLKLDRERLIEAVDKATVEALEAAWADTIQSEIDDGVLEVAA